MASPLQFKGQSGATTFVATQNIIRASELRDLYVALTLPLLSVDERLQVLLQVKYTMKVRERERERCIVLNETLEPYK